MKKYFVFSSRSGSGGAESSAPPCNDYAALLSLLDQIIGGVWLDENIFCIADDERAALPAQAFIITLGFCKN